MRYQPVLARPMLCPGDRLDHAIQHRPCDDGRDEARRIRFAAGQASIGV